MCVLQITELPTANTLTKNCQKMAKIDIVGTMAKWSLDYQQQIYWPRMGKIGQGHTHTDTYLKKFVITLLNAYISAPSWATN